MTPNPLLIMRKLQLLIQKILLKLQILKIQLAIKLLKQKRTVPNLPQPKYIVVHHGGGNWSFHQVNAHHKKKWGFKSSLGFYLGYQRWISYDGKLFIARRDNEEGAHTVERGKPHYWNRNSIGICLQGNGCKEDFTKTQLSTLTRELNKYDIPIMAHRDISPTLCPSDRLCKWLQEYRTGKT